MNAEEASLALPHPIVEGRDGYSARDADARASLLAQLLRRDRGTDATDAERSPQQLTTDVPSHIGALRTSILSWCVAAGACVAAAQLTDLLAVLPALLAAATVPSALRMGWRLGLPVAAVLATSALVPFFPVAGWLGIAVLACVALALPERTVEETSLSDLERHLSWCRRREASADLVSLRLAPAPALRPVEIRDCFRYTDSVHVSERGNGYDVLAVLDTQDLVREGVEERVTALLGPATFGWARFPDDGVTLEALLHSATTGATAAPALAGADR